MNISKRLPVADHPQVSGETHSSRPINNISKCILKTFNSRKRSRPIETEKLINEKPGNNGEKFQEMLSISQNRNQFDITRQMFKKTEERP